MAYRLMLKTKTRNPGSGNQTILIPVAIEVSPEFRNLGFNPKSYGFREIDFFTARFTDLSSLKEHLTSHGILTSNSIDDDLVIVWEEEQSNFRRKHHNLLFMDKAEFIVNPEGVLEEYMNNRAIVEDYSFFSHLIRTMADLTLAPGQESALRTFENAAYEADTEFGVKHILYSGVYMQSSAIQHFLRSLIYRDSLANNMSHSQGQEFNWWMVHHLITFVVRYSNNRDFSDRHNTDFVRVMKPQKNHDYSHSDM